METKFYGISLLEVVLSVALLMLILTMSMPLFVMHKRLFVKAELENIYGLMLYLQRKASVECSIQTLVFNTSNTTYSINNTAATSKLAQDVIFAQPRFTHNKSFKRDQLERPTSFKNGTVYFYPDGTITAGTLFLTDSKHSCAYALTCGVAQIGFIRKYRFSGDTWAILN